MPPVPACTPTSEAVGALDFGLRIPAPSRCSSVCTQAYCSNISSRGCRSRAHPLPWCTCCAASCAAVLTSGGRAGVPVQVPRGLHHLRHVPRGAGKVGGRCSGVTVAPRPRTGTVCLSESIVLSLVATPLPSSHHLQTTSSCMIVHGHVCVTLVALNQPLISPAPPLPALPVQMRLPAPPERPQLLHASRPRGDGGAVRASLL